MMPGADASIQGSERMQSWRVRVVEACFVGSCFAAVFVAVSFALGALAVGLPF